ncbi:MAG TPA: carboxypeptidase regulatory-like domain-containing protein [Candidatus Eremiobacteraceae bacterium]|nr:carboxypeptidase regulatory-like domain-containing protein [Candidatus Eremiobacteraceae bacterium]
MAASFLPVADVNVAAVSPSGSFKALSNSAGFYALTGLPVDTYVVTFSKQGFVTQPIPGVTVTQDATITLNALLQTALKTLTPVVVRGAQSLVQPNQPADRYTVNSTQIQNITGTPQNISETAVLNSLPGITTDTGGYPIIRGGAENDEGFQLEGVDATEPITGQFINSLSLSGTSRIVLETGGYDVSNGNTNSGVVNIVVKRGSYPGAGMATMTSNAPNFDHRFAIEYGNGTPDNRFSYFVSYNGLRQFRVYGDTHTFLPQEVSAVGDSSGNESNINLFYRWGQDNRNELQYFGENGANQFLFNYNVLQYGGTQSAICAPASAVVGGQTCLPYGSANLEVQNVGGVGFGGTNQTMAWSTTLFPAQVAYNQAINYSDGENNNHFIEKLNYKRQFSSNSYGDFSLFRTNVHDIFLVPWDGGAFADEYEYNASNNTGVNADYQNQISNQNLIALGGELKFTQSDFSIGIPTLEMLSEPLECGVNCGNSALGAYGYTTPGYIGYINLPHGSGGCGTAGATPTCVSPAFPLSTFVNNGSFITDPVQTWNAWIQDTWTPNDHFNVKLGLRWDEQVLHLPSNAAALSTIWTQSDAPTAGSPSLCNGAGGNTYLGTCFIDTPGAPVNTNVTRPSQISPRIALTYTPNINGRNVFRASAGTFIEFTPLSNIENTYQIPMAAYNCTIASGCFHPLPGYSATCVNGVDPANGSVPCNGINNLGQQALEDLNKNNFAQYTPVLPQRAFSADFSWEHDFGNGLDLKITPYYRKGTNYVVASTPLIGTLADGTSIFGAPIESNAGTNENTGIEWAFSKSSTFGFSGYLNGTYDNTLANYNSDFFPSVNVAAVALNHFFHVSYLAPVTATLGVVYHDRHGLLITTEFPYESGYYYGVGTHTFVYALCGQVAGCTGNPNTSVPVEVLNTDLASASLGQNTRTSAYYFTDITNPGTILNPNIVGSRGTPEGPDPGSLRSPQRLTMNMSIAHDIGSGPNHFQVGVRGTNLFGNYSPGVVGGNSRFRANGMGGYNGLGYTGGSSGGAPNSGSNNVNPSYEPLQFPRGPYPYESEATGAARLYTFFISSNF